MALLLFVSGYIFAQVDSNKTNQLTAITSKALQHPAPELKLYPNPAKNKITLQVKGFETGMITVKIIDEKGKLQRQDSRLLVAGDEEVVMFLALKPGIYYAMVVQNGKLAKKKLVIL